MVGSTGRSLDKQGPLTRSSACVLVTAHFRGALPMTFVNPQDRRSRRLSVVSQLSVAHALCCALAACEKEEAAQPTPAALTPQSSRGTMQIAVSSTVHGITTET